MKQLVLPKRPLPPYVEKHVGPAIELAYGFLCAKYGWQFDDVVLVIQPTACRCRYFSNKLKKHKLFGHQPVATINTATRCTCTRRTHLAGIAKV